MSMADTTNTNVI